MGNSATCLGPNLDLMTSFPSTSSVTSALSLQNDALGTQAMLTNYVATATSLTPVAGPFLYYIIAFLGSTDFSDIGSAYAKAQIDKALLENQVHEYNAEVTVIRNSFLRMNSTQLTPDKIQPDLIYALRRSEYLFSLFKNPAHLFYKYPLVSMPYFIKISTLLYVVAKLSSKLDPTLEQANQATELEIEKLTKIYVKNFLEVRLEKITYYNCGFTIFSSQCLVYDRPWIVKPGKITNYFLTAYQFDKPLSQDEWRDGIVIRTPNGCQPEARDYPNLQTYKDSDEYKRNLKENYMNYFGKVVPVAVK